MSHKLPMSLPAARLAWPSDQPLNLEFQDPYFSSDDGAAESQYVFIRHNDLARRFATAEQFCVAELGFGTGLNFLLSWQLWERVASPAARLDYLAVEARPLQAQQMRRALAAWPELAPQLESLCHRLPPPQPGFHLLNLSPRVNLLLLYGDVQAMLASCTAAVDAWFFDGFAPARNPAMWSPATFQLAARLSRPGASFATYTAAASARRALLAAGFEVSKAKGYGRKREMLHGQISNPPENRSSPPWFRYPANPPGQRYVVVGDGLVGAWTARLLAEAGCAVLMIGAGDGATTRIPAFLVRAYPERQASLSHRLYAQAYAQARDDYPRYCPESYQQIVLQPDEREAGVVDAASARASLLNHPLIEHRHARLETLHWTETHWELALRQHTGPIAADRLIICTARIPEFLRDWYAAPLQDVAGQVAVLGQPQPQARCGAVHWIPHGSGSLLGSSYRPQERATDIRLEENRTLLRSAKAAWPDLAIDEAAVVRSSHAAQRSASLDHLPVLGPCPDQQAWEANFSDLHLGRAASRYPIARNWPGLWLNLGHGSRGASLAPLAARLLLAAMQDRPLPLETDLLAAIHPGRFAIRNFRRRRGSMRP